MLDATGRARVTDFIAKAFATEFLHACEQLEWKLVLNEGKELYHLSNADLAAMGAEKRNAMLGAVYENAKDRFQYLYESYHIADQYNSGAGRTGIAAQFFEAMNSEAGLEALRALTGDQNIKYMDAIATRYRPGHFLTVHNDFVPGEDRLFAYVLNLSPQWRADWGGLLLFLSDDGNVSGGYTPRFGALNIFKVPQAHSVSVVSPFAGAPRYSISGWFRSSRPTPKT